MTLRARLTQLEKQVTARAGGEDMVVIVLTQWGEDPAPSPGPPEELVQHRIAEARNAGQSCAVILWPETSQGEA